MHVLLVEDNDDHAELIIELIALQEKDIRVDRVSNGERAIEFLEGNGPFQNMSTPDLILLDYKLPGLSGLDVLRILKSVKEWRLIPIVVLSTSNASRDRQAAYKNGANSYAVKPMGFAEFKALVGVLMEYWSSVNYGPNRLNHSVEMLLKV